MYLVLTTALTMSNNILLDILAFVDDIYAVSLNIINADDTVQY